MFKTQPPLRPLTSLLIVSSLLAGNSRSTDANQVEKVPSIITDRPRFEPVDDKVAVLRMIHSRSIANWEQLKTWSGVFTFQERMYLDEERARPFLFNAKEGTDPKPPLRKEVSGTVSFKTDVEQNAVFIDFHCMLPTITEAETGRVVDFPATEYHRQSIIKADDYLHFQPNIEHGRFRDGPKVGSRSGRAAFRDPLEETAGQQNGYLVDPRQFFMWSNKTCWDWMGFLADRLEESTGTELEQVVHESIRVLRGGSDENPQWRVVLESPGSRGATITQTITIDATSGFNAVDVVTKKDGSRTLDHWKWEYEEREGIALPASVRYVQPTPDGKKIYFERNLHLTDCVLNKPVPAEEFTVAAFGLVDGERFMDRVDNRLYLVKDGEFVEAVASISSASSIPKANFRRLLPKLLPAVVLFAVMGVLGLRRRQRRNAAVQKK